jgi:hypothetical protein
MLTVANGQVVSGTITYAVVTDDNKKKEKQLQIAVEVTKKLAGDKPGPADENVPPTEVVTFLHLDEAGDPESKRRNIARDRIAKLTDGVQIETEWTDAGFLRLIEDHPESLIPKIQGKEVLLKAREYNGKFYYDLYWPREKPKPLTMKEVLEKLKPY